MAIDGEAHRILVVFRSAPTLMALCSQDGHVVAETETCGDADDVFVDRKRGRVYASYGEGVVDMSMCSSQSKLATGSSRVPTTPGARTSLFVHAERQGFIC